MSETGKNPRPPLWRRLFQWCRLLVLIGTLCLLTAAVLFHQAGLPNFLTDRVVEAARNRGWNLHFTRARLRWFHGALLENAAISPVQSDPNLPAISVGAAEISFPLRPSGRRGFEFESIHLRDALLTWTTSNHPPALLRIRSADAGFPQRDEIQIDNLDATFGRIRLRLSANVENLSEIAKWKTFQPSGKPPKVPWRVRIFDALEQIRLSGIPEIKISLYGDGRRPETLDASARLDLPAIDSPWGRSTNLHFAFQLKPRSIHRSRNTAALLLSADFLEANRFSVAPFLFRGSGIAVNPGLEDWRTEVDCKCRNIQASWPMAADAPSHRATAGELELSSSTILSFTNQAAFSSEAKLVLTQFESEKRKASRAAARVVVQRVDGPPAPADLGFWKPLLPFAIRGDMEVEDYDDQKLKLDRMQLTGNWSAPSLEIKSLGATLYGGEFEGGGNLNVDSRRVEFRGKSSFDLHQLNPLLTPFGRRWLSQYTWEKPPALQGALSLRLPAWTNAEPDWRQEILPGLVIDGHVDLGRGAFREVSALSASTDFQYSNRIWTVPHLRAIRPEGSLDLNYVGSDRTLDYRFRIRSEIDPVAAKSLLDPEERRIFDYFQLSSPPLIRAEVVGRWHAREEIGVDAEVVASNLVVRGAAMDTLFGSVHYTNLFLTASDVHVERSDQRIRAQKIEFEIPTRKLRFTNVYGTADPMIVADAIGPKTSAAIEPYRFEEPPAVRLDGVITVGDREEADMHFLVEGRRFKVGKLRADRLLGKIDWVGETLTLTNVEAQAYGGGRLAGSAFFDFKPRQGADLHFEVAAADIDLQAMMTSLNQATNRLEGTIGGVLNITSGNSLDLSTWQGFGRANLREGFIWEIPIFGIFSPILNAIMPGVGKSKAREASANFTITNGVAHSEDLEIRASTLRLQYRGTVDYKQNVNATVEAEILRDAWVVGKLLSLAFMPFTKLFEYKVSGTLDRPLSEPLHIPKFLMFALRPFHSLKEMIPDRIEPPSEAIKPK